MKRIITFMLSASMLISTLPARAAGGDYEKIFSASSTDMTGYEITDGYAIDDNGLFDKNLSRKLMYKDKTFSGKYEYEITFRSEFENSLNILFNYVDANNYSYIEIQPEVKKASLKAISSGVMTTGGLYDIEADINSDTWLSARIVSNGGRGISLSLSTGGEYTDIFTGKYLKNGSQSGYIGYDAAGNPLAVRSIKVKDLGEADFVEPEMIISSDVEQEKNEEAQVNTQVAQRSDDTLKLMCSLGIMKETENGLDGGAYIGLDEMTEIAANLKFAYSPEPEQYITEKKALDFIFSLLWCTIKMTDSEKYARALSMGLLKKTTYTGKGYINRYDMAQMIYNAFDKPMFYDKERCIFDNVLKLRKVKGQVTDNGITALDAKSEAGVGNVIVGDVLLQNKTDWKATELIGRIVEGYYSEDDELLYVKPVNNEEVLHIDASKVEDFSDNTFTYEHNGTGRLKTIDVTAGASLVYNGEHMPSYEDELFENIENGDITLVSSDNSGNYDTIIVEAYENFVIASIFTPELAIYNAAYDVKDDNNRLYKIDLSDYEFIEIFAADGTPMTFEQLKTEYALSVAASSNYLKLIVSETQETGFTIRSMSEDEDGRTVVGNGEKTYTISPSYFNAYEKKELEMGTVYTFLINSFGDIVWATLSAQYIYETGCLAKVTVDNDEECAYIHVFETDGEIQHFKTADNITFMDEAGIVSRLDSDELYEVLKDKNELVTYKLNNDDLLAEIQLPYNGYKEDCPNRIMKLCDVEKDHFYYKDVAYAFGYKYFFGNIKRMFTVASEDADNPYRYGAIDRVSRFTNADTYKMKCYSEKSDYLVDYAIIYDYKTGNTRPTIRNRELVVTDVSYELYEDEPKYKISGYSSAEVAVYCDPEVAENAYDIFSYADKENAQKHYKVQKGDVIKYSTDYVTGEITDIVIIYRSTEPHPETGSAGWVLGATGIEQNPFAIDATYKTSINPTRDGGSRRFFYGWVYDSEGGVLTVTTQDLGHYGNYYKWVNPDSNDYVSEYHTLAAYPGVTLQENAETGRLEVANKLDIRTFKQYGVNCSRVLICTTNTNNYYFMIVLNNQQ